MAEASLPVPAAPTLAPAVGGWRTMLPAPLAGLAAEPALARALPALGLVGAAAGAAMLWTVFAQGPQRVLYSSLSDADRAKVVETLEAGGIGYSIDSGTGALSVAEDELYRARMLVASDGGIAAPAGATEMLDAIPLGTSRTLEGERLRLARERELMLSIREIEGIESVRVHLATPERSVFVRETSAPSASVMVKLVGGRQLAPSQVEAIVNLVAASVPGMSAEAVRVVDDSGRLLSSPKAQGEDALTLQRELESKLQGQLDALLLPLLGEGNYSSQVQAELDPDEITTARETYEKEGVVRAESERNATRTGTAPPGGVPGVPANTPPPDATLVDGAPQPPPPGAGGTSDSESAVERSYELGREVAVTSTRPGGLVKLSVAVAVSNEALKAAKPLTARQLEELVSAAVGANAARGDRVEVVASAFDNTELPAPAFYETPWFALLVRYGAALLAVLLVLLFAVRPLIAWLKKPRGSGAAAGLLAEPDGAAAAAAGDDAALPELTAAGALSGAALGDLTTRVELARRLAASQPDRAAEALQRMLAAPDPARPEADDQ